MIKEMDKEGLETYLKIKQLKTASPTDVMMMQTFTQQYIDAKCTICKSCSAQIRFAFNRIINWGNKHNVDSLTFDYVKEDVITEEVNEPKKRGRKKKNE